MRTEEHLAAFGRDGAALEVAGIPLERLAARVGSTPFFAYDRAAITTRVAEVRAALPDRVGLGYAVKANPMPAVVQHLSRLVDSLDVASAGELAVALDTGHDPARISFAGPGKTDAELRRAVAAGAVVEIESRTELQRLVRTGKELAVRPQAAVRVNPPFAVKGSGMRMGGGPQQFGVDAEMVPSLLGEVSPGDVDVLGFHVFAGSQNLRADILVEAQARTVDLVLELATHLRDEVRYVNLGGGFGIPYFEKDERLDLALVGQRLGELLDERLVEALPHAAVSLELGRYLVGEAGVYVTQVVDVKESRGQAYAVVDGGMHHQLAASGNFGQVIRRNYPMALGNRLGDPDTGPVTVVGCLCTPLDLLGDSVELPRPDVGDLVVVFQAGAYGLTASPTAFLGHPAPAEVLL
ncbi:pyridoxal-dependent decarboxylase, exosortase A system-associated [Nocardioides sp. zg-1308]|uniref:Pyridoxal-dependent decarboxylase, exosortase A system-associated n=1 Tax=Nocardioides renjunii TaxID=3095075 RepID=A0ABU5K6F9_9ACTN|nr:MULTISPECIES: pyridoxal-dependent decarboxylase, exosortase A system-associated [unclassified Nocardioides]MDZ5660552.1 pyridoxal-dependent decarboxylase, exosortase A system-associated [Nocardioides sp. S-58]NPD03668.1 pyridoxal-dependent decarboxylase, exosortase A system-associated [Nocardioides sp. zg-1308]